MGIGGRVFHNSGDPVVKFIVPIDNLSHRAFVPEVFFCGFFSENHGERDFQSGFWIAFDHLERKNVKHGLVCIKDTFFEKSLVLIGKHSFHRRAESHSIHDFRQLFHHCRANRCWRPGKLTRLSRYGPFGDNPKDIIRVGVVPIVRKFVPDVR